MVAAAKKLRLVPAEDFFKSSQTGAKGLNSPELDHEPQSLSQALPAGRLVELSGQGAVARSSVAVSLLLEAQAQGESCAWIQLADGGLYVPDLTTAGVDLDSLIVLQIPRRAGTPALLRSAELLLRSGAFGMLVVDLEGQRPTGSPSAWQGRLLGLARQHESRVVFLSRADRERGSLGPLIGLRVEARRHRLARGRFSIEGDVLKNKSGAPFCFPTLAMRGPWGLR